MTDTLIGAGAGQSETLRRTLINPATLEPIACVSLAGQTDARTAAASAQAAQPAWARVPAHEKFLLLREVAAGIRARAATLGSLLSSEAGIPRCEAVDCAGWAADSIEQWAARCAAQSVTASAHGKPGVVAALAAADFPLLSLASKVAKALVDGNTVVCAPGAGATLASLALAQVFELLPRGVVNLVAGTDAALLGPGGFAAVDAAAVHGQESVVILEDADLEVAAPGAVWSLLRRSGQAGSGKRIYVVESLAAQFADRIHESAAFLEVGDPSKGDTDLGPLQSHETARRVEELVARAAKEGARLKLGGRCFAPWGLPGHFFQPTILTEVRHGSAAARADLRGPVMLVIPVAGALEAIGCAGSLGCGTTTWVYTRDPARAKFLSRSFGPDAWVADSLHGTGAGTGTVEAAGTGAGAMPRTSRDTVRFEHIATRRPWWFPYRDRAAHYMR